MANFKHEDQLEEIINWTLPGLTMYYRDCNLNPEIINKYSVGKIFRSKTFVDVSYFAGKPITNCRFIFASSKAAPLFRVNPATEKWGLHAINCDSFFKVLDVYQFQEVTQIFVLHIPYKGLDIFSRSVLNLGGQNIEEQIIAKARESLHQKYNSGILAALCEQEWLHRTSFPIGLDNNNNFFSLEPTEPFYAEARPLHSAIKKMTNDLSDLNEMPEFSVRKTETNPEQPQNLEKKGGFWSNLFGKK
jgi:hypothetical protein